MAQEFGMCRKDDGISDFFKVYIMQGDVCVVGYIGEGASKQLTNQWQSPLEEDTAGQMMGEIRQGLSRVADLAQIHTGKTSKTVFNTAMVWNGIGPHELSLPLYFKAYHNAKKEVNDAIMWLEKMSSPELFDGDFAGALMGSKGISTIPQTCIVNVGRRLILKDCLITDVSSELDVPKTKDGYMTRNTVQLQITMNRMTNRSKVDSLYI